MPYPIYLDLLPGSCYCKPGYAGEKCDQCDLGYKGYPDCEQCNCSVSGSINEDPCVDPCICKVTVFKGTLNNHKPI